MTLLRRLLLLLALWLPSLALTVAVTPDVIATVVCLLLPLAAEAMLVFWPFRRSASERVRRTVNILRAILIFILLFLGAFQMVLLCLYGQGIITSDMFLNLVTTNTSEASETLGGLGLWGSLVIVFYVGVVALCAWRLPSLLAGGLRPIPLRILTYTLIATLILAAFIPEPPTRYLYPVNVFHQAALACRASYRLRHYAETSADYSDPLPPRLADDTTSRLAIIVIGETSRAHNWQLLGYHRPTNPRLSQRPGVIPFRHAYTGSNTTHRAVPLLLSIVSPQHFDDSIHMVRSIITAFRQAGWHTSAISAQPPNGSYIQFFLSEADTTLWLPAPGREGDLAILPYLRSRMAQAAPRELIVVHSYGSHYNYFDRYPRSFARFLPDEPTTAVATNRPALINAYDNSILLTDAFLDSVIGLASATGRPAALLYAADHGEDIFDDARELFMHASPVPSSYQLHVAMIAWLSPGYRQLYPMRAAMLHTIAHSPLLTSDAFPRIARHL